MTNAAESGPVIPELTLGDRLIVALRRSKRSAQDMADEFQVTRQTISRWMNDHGAPPKDVYVKHWALMTGVDQHWLLTGEVRPPADPDGVGPVGLEPTTYGLQVRGFEHSASILTFPADRGHTARRAA